MHFHRWTHVQRPGDKIGSHDEGVCTRCNCVGQSWYDGMSGGYHRIAGRTPTSDLRAVDHTLAARALGTTPTYPTLPGQPAIHF